MGTFVEICGRLADIVPTLRGPRHPCGDEMIPFCCWCLRELDDDPSSSKYIQESVLKTMTAEEIQSAYARWRIEVKE